MSQGYATLGTACSIRVDLDLYTDSRSPAHCTVIGKLLLANLPDSKQDELLAKMKLAKRGPNTITNKKALRDELDAVLDAPASRTAQMPTRGASGS